MLVPAVVLAVLGRVRCLFACAWRCMLLCARVRADVRATAPVCAGGARVRVPVCVVPVGALGVCCVQSCVRDGSVACVLVRLHSQAKERRVHVRGFGRIREPKCRASAE